MERKLYVGSISFNATEEDLMKFFSEVGKVESVKIITDANTGQSKGFAFIEMASEDEAKKAISDLNGASFMERTIVVNEARPRQPRDNRGFGPGRGGYDSRGKGREGGFGHKGKGAGPGRRGRR